jgi:MFS family permease
MIIVLAFFMPETLPVGRRKLLSFKQIWHSINAQRAIIYQTFQKRPLGALILVNLIIQLSMVPLRNVALYWGQWKFGWSTNTQAYFLGVTIVSSLIGSILGPRLLLPTGIENFDAAYYYSRMVIIMASIAAAACIALSLVTTTYGVIISVFFFSVGTGCTPALSAQISAEAHAGEQGQVQGINSAVSSLAWAVGIYAYWGMFDTFIDDEFSFDDDANATHTTVVLGGVFWMFNMCIMIVVIVLELWVALNQGSKTKNDPEQRLLLAEMTDAQAS